MITQPLRHRDFRLLWIGQTISLFGSALYGVALPFQVFALHGTPLQLGLAFALYSTVQVATILFGGAIVDRLPRRPVILLSDFGGAVVSGAISVLGAAGLLRIEHLYVASGLAGLSAAFYLPAMSAIMPDLIPADVLAAANSLRSLSRQASRVVGPLIGGVIVLTQGPAAAFALDGISFAVSCGLFSLARSVPPHAVEPQPLLASVARGIAFVVSVPWIRLTVVVFAVINLFFVGCFTVGLPLLVRDVLGGGAVTFGLIGSASGIGEVLGSLLIGTVRLPRLGVSMYICYVLTGIALLGYGLSPALPPVLASAALLSAGLVAGNTLWDTALQRTVPRELLGRVTSVDYFGSSVTQPVAPLLSAALGAAWGPSAIFVGSGICTAAFTLTVLAFSRSIRALP
jgi:MFS family permease